jgi:hypothetical protein
MHGKSDGPIRAPNFSFARPFLISQSSRAAKSLAASVSEMWMTCLAMIANIRGFRGFYGVFGLGGL